MSNKRLRKKAQKQQKYRELEATLGHISKKDKKYLYRATKKFATQDIFSSIYEADQAFINACNVFERLIDNFTPSIDLIIAEMSEKSTDTEIDRLRAAIESEFGYTIHNNFKNVKFYRNAYDAIDSYYEYVGLREANRYIENLQNAISATGTDVTPNELFIRACKHAFDTIPERYNAHQMEVMIKYYYEEFTEEIFYSSDQVRLSAGRNKRKRFKTKAGSSSKLTKF